MYRRKAYYLGLQSMPGGNKHDMAMKNIKKDFIKLVDDLQSKHNIEREEEYPMLCLDI